MRGLVLLLSDAAVSHALSHHRVFDMAKRFLEHAKHAPSLMREFYSSIISTSRVRGLRESTNRPGLSLSEKISSHSLEYFRPPSAYTCTLAPYGCITRGIRRHLRALAYVHARFTPRATRALHGIRYNIALIIYLDAPGS